jgi:hypothetical protein
LQANYSEQPARTPKKTFKFLFVLHPSFKVKKVLRGYAMRNCVFFISEFNA